MHLTRLSLADFRSYADAQIEPGPGFVVLTGENGAGKTNILEAVSLLAPGRGLRRAPLLEMARQGGPGGFAVSARLEGDGGLVEIGTGTNAASPERRLLKINGAGAALTGLGEWLTVLWLTPAMDRLFTEPASGRRRFLDRFTLALEPAHAHHAARYDAAMRARNKLLAEPAKADPTWLSALESGMAEHGAMLAEARGHMVAALSDRLEKQPESPFARAEIVLDGWLPAADDAMASLAADLKSARGRDAAAGRATTGPHRTDLLVRHAAKAQAAALCSTGEQKALLLGLVIAHADLVAERRGSRPILLLDEVAAHLDPGRRAALFERLAAAGGQVWMTGTESALFSALPVGATHLSMGDHGGWIAD